MPNSMNTPQSQPLFCCGYVGETSMVRSTPYRFLPNLRAFLKIEYSKYSSLLFRMLSQTVRVLPSNFAKNQWRLSLTGMMREQFLSMPFFLRYLRIIFSVLPIVVVAKQEFNSLHCEFLVRFLSMSSMQMLIASSLSHSPWSIPPMALKVSFSTLSSFVFLISAAPRFFSRQIVCILAKWSKEMLGQSSLSLVYLHILNWVISLLQSRLKSRICFSACCSFLVFAYFYGSQMFVLLWASCTRFSCKDSLFTRSVNSLTSSMIAWLYQSSSLLFFIFSLNYSSRSMTSLYSALL